MLDKLTIKEILSILFIFQGINLVMLFMVMVRVIILEIRNAGN